jgi:hypothetical protein
LLNLDVKLSAENNVELNIYDNEDVDEKLKEFSREYDLNEYKLQKLRTLVQLTLMESQKSN